MALHLSSPAPMRSRARRGASVAVALALLLPGLTQCDPADEGPPPATAATPGIAAVDPGARADVPSAPLQQPGPPTADPPVPPSPPSAPPGAPANDSTRYASDEYDVGADTDTGPDAYDDNDPSALNDFRQALAPYGAWVDDPTYGTIWVPSPEAVGADFTPYVSAGHWVYGDDYVWASDYPWGWAPFHYGRWVAIEGRGWSWIPGREYRGAWVAWSVDDAYSYVGWAPLGPSFVWFGGVPVGFHGYWGPRWSYCPRGEVFAPRVGAHVVVGPSAVTIASRMRPYAVAGVRVGGPPPARLGYDVSRIPRATAVPGVERAQQFARPSSARPLGASAPARFESTPAVRDGARPALITGPRPTRIESAPRPEAPGGFAPRPVTPSGGFAPNVNRAQAPAPMRAPAPSVAPIRSAPAPHFGGGAGHHR